MPGLLDFLNTPAGQGLLSGVASYAMNARRGTPFNNIGRGLAGGVAGYAGAQDQIKQDAQDAYTKKLQEMQLAQMKATMDEKQASQESMSRLLNPDSYQTMTNTSVQGTRNIPTPPKIGAVAPDYTLTKQAFTDMVSTPSMDNAARNRDLVAAGLAPEILKQQLAPKKINYRDVGDALVPYDEITGMTRDDLKPIPKGLSPESQQTLAIENFKFNNLSAYQMASNNLTARGQDITIRGQDRTDARSRDLAADKKTQDSKAPSGYRYTDKGDLEVIPGGPADAKNQAKLFGSSTVDTVLTALRDRYTQLENGGGIVSTKNRFGTNIGSWTQSSGGGQLLGGMFGTENQSARDSIAQTRPILLQAIMKATGMSAKQMDSNAELKLYLSTATDPKLGLEANRRAMDMIEKLYGSGSSDSVTSIPKNEVMPPDASTFADKLPTANASNKGQRVRDTVTGKILKSNGIQWKPE